MSCKHTAFIANVNVNRVEDIGRYTADVTVKCAECGVPFKFLGLSCGMDYNGACVSVDGTEARLGIAPENEVIPELEGTPYGFTVRKII